MTTQPDRQARIAGLLYLTVAVFGGFAHFAVRGSIFEAGRAAATALNVVEHVNLMRAGVVADLLQATVFVFLGLVLYRMLESVDRWLAATMVVLVAIATTIICLNMVFQIGGLIVATHTTYTAAFGPAASNALVLLAFDIHSHGYLIAQIFFGLWLVPLGLLARRSGMFAPALAVLLVIGGLLYVAGTAIELVSPRIATMLGDLIYLPSTVAEIWMIGALLVRGFAPRRSRQGSQTGVATPAL